MQNHSRGAREAVEQELRGGKTLQASMRVSHDICDRIYPAEVFTASESAEESEGEARGSPDWTDTFCSAYFLASSVF